MANENPIKGTDNGQYPDFFIPKAFSEKTLFITTTTELIKEDWELDLIHALSVDGKPVNFDPTPDLDRAELGICKDLKGKKFALASIAVRINNGSSGKPSKVKYSIKFEADDELIDEEFVFTSTEKNPFTFYTKVTLKLK